jgi:hypothetical protein
VSRQGALRALESQLRAKPPKALSSLSDDELADLNAAVEAARHHQAAELQAAGEKALGHIPRLLRMPIRKVMGG